MMQYDGDQHIPKHYLVDAARDRAHDGRVPRAPTGVPQLAISETQKYGHVTYFWNGNRRGSTTQLETYVEIPSDNVPFDSTPWMKAPRSRPA